MRIPSHPPKNLPSVGRFLVNLLFPPSCYSCKKPGSYLCEPCMPSLGLPHSQCPHCKRRLPFGVLERACRSETGLTRLFTCASYDNAPVRRLIHDCKFKYAFALAEPLAAFAYHWMVQEKYAFLLAEVDVILPVPSHKRREKNRGFNPADKIAFHFSQYAGIPYERGLLVKTKATPSQVEVRVRKERLKNLTGAFAVPAPEAIQGKRVLLIDDVTTTGSTLKECAHTLRASGAKEVWGLVVAKD